MARFSISIAGMKSSRAVSQDHYPDYKKVDATHGKIGDIDVVWNITPSENNAYQNNLDETLLKQLMHRQMTRLTSSW
mgnify:CR=1 FL=1